MRSVVAFHMTTSAIGVTAMAAGTAAALTAPRRVPTRYRAGLTAMADALLQRAALYKVGESSPEWKAHLRATPPDQRHTESVRRRTYVLVALAQERAICLFCWLPHSYCMCDSIPCLADELRDHGRCVVSLSIHAEEFMRSSNSGHIAAMVLDAPLLFWGIPEHDATLELLASPDPSEARAALASLHGGAAVGDTTAPFETVALYPSVDCQPFGSMMARMLAARQGSQAPAPVPAASSSSSLTASLVEAPAGGSTSPLCHLLLLDATWGQASRLNRHVPAAIPRVGLTIPATYESMFAPLRTQTRKSGVSTLEATRLAIDEYLDGCLATGSTSDAANAGESGGAAAAAVKAAVSETLASVMRRFVDTGRIMRCEDPVFGAADGKDNGGGNNDPSAASAEAMAEGAGGDDGTAPTAGRAPWRLASAEAAEAAQRAKAALAPALRAHNLHSQCVAAARRRTTTAAERRAALPPPVAVFCYACDRFMSLTRMEEHVSGAGHRRAWRERGETWAPSEASRRCEAPLRVASGPGLWYMLGGQPSMARFGGSPLGPADEDAAEGEPGEDSDDGSDVSAALSTPPPAPAA